LFRCFGPVFKQPKQTEKISKKQISIRVSSKQLIFFFSSNRNKPKLYLFRLFFALFFSRSQTKFFSVCFGVSDRYRNNLNKQNLWYGGIKKVYIVTNLLLFWLVFCLFRLFRNTETRCFDIKAKQPKQTSCFGVPKLVSVPVSVVSIRNKFWRTPYFLSLGILSSLNTAASFPHLIFSLFITVHFSPSLLFLFLITIPFLPHLYSFFPHGLIILS
jgi:hypothetical protein